MQLNLIPAPIEKEAFLEKFYYEEELNSTNRLDECLQPPEFQYDKDFYKYLFLDPDPSKSGDWGELFVCQLALKKGGHVYRNVGSTGKTDIIIEYKGNCFHIDVKVACRRYKRNEEGKAVAVGWKQAHRFKFEENVYGVCVIPAKSGIYARWYYADRGRNTHLACPKGLESFWSESII